MSEMQSRGVHTDRDLQQPSRHQSFSVRIKNVQ